MPLLPRCMFSFFFFFFFLSPRCNKCVPGDVVTICGEIKTIRTDELEGRRVYEKKSTFILYMEAHSITLVGGGKRKKKKHSAQPSNNSRFNTNDEDDDQVTPTFDVLVLLVV